MPDSVEMPAPVNGTMAEASAIMSPSRSMPLCRSGAIIGTLRTIVPDENVQVRWRCPWPRSRSGRVGDALGRFVLARFVLLRLGHRRRLRLLCRLAVLRQLLQLGFQFGL